MATITLFSRSLGLAFVAVVLLALACVPAGAQSTFTEGQKVEVREGDTWSKASIIKKEGRRYQIRYDGDDATEEWVFADRIRAAGGAAGGGAVPAGAGGAATRPAAVKPVAKAPNFAVGQDVEIKWGGSWRKATVMNKVDGWTLIKYDPGSSHEWVEPYRIRKIGSGYDIGHAQPNRSFFRIEPAPRNPPPAAPADAGTGRGGFPADDPSVGMKDDPAFKEPDWSDVPTLDLNVPGGAWNLPADPAPVAVAKIAPRSISLKGASGEFFESIKSVVISKSVPLTALVSHVNTAPGKPAEARIEKVNIGGGGSVGVYPMPSKTELVDISPDGKSYLLRSDDIQIGAKGRLEVWSLEGAAPKRTLVFLPKGNADWAHRDVPTALFVDSAHLLTVDTDGKLALWNVATCKAVYSCNLGHGVTPALSAGGKYLAIGTGKRVVILEALTGKALAELPTVYDSGGRFAFSPSGLQLAAWHGNSVEVWDLATGKAIREFNVPVSGQSFAIAADGYGLVDGIYLIDFERRIVLWNYGIRRVAGDVAPGGQYWFAGGDAQQRTKVATLAGIQVPSAEALAVAKTLNADELMLLKPGAKISVMLNIAIDEQQRQQILQAIKAQFAGRQIEMADNQPIRLVATIESGKSEERSYRRIGGPGAAFAGTQKVTITPQISKLVIESDGKSAWEMSTVSAPGGFLNLKEGQTIDQAVAEASKPNINFFKTTRLPSYLAKPRTPAWHGSSELRP